MSVKCSACGASLRPMTMILPDGIDDNLGRACLELGRAMTTSAVCDNCARARREVEAAELSERLIANRLSESGLPSRLCEDYDPRLGNAGLLAWMMDNTLSSMWIQSAKSGRGKTRTCAHLAYRIIRAHAVKVRFIKASEACSTYAALLGESNASAVRLKTGLIKADLLIIDDLGKGRLTPSGGELMFEILDRRTEANSRTWVTSNFSGAELESRLGDYGPYIRRRLAETMETYDADNNRPVKIKTTLV